MWLRRPELDLQNSGKCVVLVLVVLLEEKVVRLAPIRPCHVCVCVCVRARAYVRVCVCVPPHV
jgi:hypothetical protein